MEHASNKPLLSMNFVSASLIITSVSTQYKSPVQVLPLGLVSVVVTAVVPALVSKFLRV